MKWLIVEDALRDRRGHWLEHGEPAADGGPVKFASLLFHGRARTEQ
jgi:hypothetical protein